MGIYAQRPRQRLGQLLGDLFVLAWAVAWFLVARAARRLVLEVAVPARRTAATADQVSDDLRQTGEQAARIPLVGDQLRQPLDAASGSVAGLVTAAQQQVASIERLASLTGWLVFLIPVTLLVVVWLPRRIRFVLHARAAQQFLDSSADLDLFALRAMTSQPLRVLAAISPDPVSAWRSGDAVVIARLAEVELRRVGLAVPAALPVDPGEDGGPRRGGDRS